MKNRITILVYRDNLLERMRVMISFTMETIEKIPTGIPGLDHIALGRLPKHRTSLISGTSGSAKSVMAAQFLAMGIIRFNETGVFVTFEEPPDDIRRNMLSLGWDIGR
jgi:circadian clock protein KaiC